MQDWPQIDTDESRSNVCCPAVSRQSIITGTDGGHWNGMNPDKIQRAENKIDRIYMIYRIRSEPITES
jgi:hypothetical protein